MNGESLSQPRLGAFAGEPVRTEFDRTPSLGGWRPPARSVTGAPDYGVDAPYTILGAFAAAAVSASFASALGSVRPQRRPILLLAGINWLVALGAAALGTSLVAYGKRGKLNHRDRVLGLIAWTGSERVLDIGTGRGLLMIGAAKRLVAGKAFGIDLWRDADLTNNNRESTMRNAFLEGVVDKVDVRFEDARKLEFQRDSFDVVFCSLTLHSLDKDGRDSACREIARVLRPGGTAIVSDYASVAGYAAALRSAGLRVRAVASGWNTFTYLRTIVAEKPR
ncbi:MAG: class I SAM-dependent methyltransferase [Candidatus Eremiobacteraeota bacterium]|nr:class I SAM-dependent methyltransferase [Candidatus Eremiobacteraeota bacterium]